MTRCASKSYPVAILTHKPFNSQQFEQTNVEGYVLYGVALVVAAVDRVVSGKV